MKIGDKVRLIAMVLTIALAVTVCDEPPSAPTEESPVSGPDLDELPGLVVSLSRGFSDAQPLAFVSLRPGSLEGETRILVSNNRDGSSTGVSIVDGGFDPVAVPVAPGDMIDLSLQDGLSSSISTLPIPLLPPVIVRTYPPKRRTSVPLNAVISIVFSEPIDPASITAETIKLRGPRGQIPLAFVLREQGTVVEASPMTELLPSSDHVLEIDTGVRDLSADHLEQAETVEFTTVEVDLGTDPVRLLPDTLRLPLGSYSGFLVVVDNGTRIIREYPDTALSWATTDPSIVSMDGVGNVGGVAIGEAHVTVEYGGEIDSALVIVTTSPPPGPFSVFPDGAYLPVGSELQFDVRHPEGTERPSVSWSSTDPSVFLVDESGLVTAIGSGQAYLVANSGVEVDSADIEVFEPIDPIASDWDVSENPLALEVGSSFGLELVPVNGSASTPPPFNWSSLDPSIAAVDQEGLVMAVSPGKTMITALFEDGSGSVAEVEIFEIGDLPRITLDPSDVTVSVGDTIRFEVLRDSAASALYGDRWPAWSWSSRGEVIRHVLIPEPGVFEAVDTGTVRIVAHVGTLQTSPGTVTVKE